MSFSRRSFCTRVFTTCSLGLLPKRGFGRHLRADSDRTPPFFLYIWYGPGADASNLFDARPLALTHAGKIQNYLGEDPVPWTGINGQSTLITRLANPLKPFLKRFSILNGVQMATSDDGHSQNISYFLTGNPLLSGPSLLAQLGQNAVPLDFLQVGNYFDFNPITYTNAPSGLNTTVEDAIALSESIKSAQAFMLGATPPEVGDHIINRARWIGGRGNGLFSQGSRDLAEGMTSQNSLRQKLARIDQTVETSAGARAAWLTHQYFVHGITDGAMIVLGNETLDAHSVGQAKRQALVLESILKEVVAIFSYLEQTPYDEARGLSLLDVTTVVCGPEFSRTMRQEGRPIDQTGTDHNPLTNSLLIGGYGIKGGLVLGASDLDALDLNGQFKGVSPAHRQLDPLLIKSMGRCFDPGSLAPMPDLPERFDPSHYLSINMVVNTLYELFRSPEAFKRRFRPNGPVTPYLPGLLV